MNIDDNATFLIVLSLGTLAASIVGALIGLVVGRWRDRVEAARVDAACPDCVRDVFHNACTTRAERANEVDNLMATLAHVTPAQPSRDESS